MRAETSMTGGLSAPRPDRLDFGDSLSKPGGDKIGDRGKVFAAKLIKLRQGFDYFASQPSDGGGANVIGLSCYSKSDGINQMVYGGFDICGRQQINE